MIQAPSARSKVRSITFAVVAVASVAIAAACSLSSRANGEACIKDSDCLSGFCVQATCEPAPPLLDAEVNGDGYGGPVDSSMAEASAAESGTGIDTGTTMADTGSSSGGDSSAPETSAGDSGSSDTGTE
jgi:hypothetical protein